MCGVFREGRRYGVVGVGRVFRELWERRLIGFWRVGCKGFEREV